MHHAGGGANFCVGIGRHVFLDEVDKARLALHQAQQLQGSGVVGDLDGFFDQFFHRDFDALFYDFFDNLLNGHLDARFHNFFHDLLDRNFDAHFLGRHIGGKGFTRANAGHVGGQAAVAEDGKKAADRNGDAAQKRWGGVVHESTSRRPFSGPDGIDSQPVTDDSKSVRGAQWQPVEASDFKGWAYAPLQTG